MKNLNNFKLRELFELKRYFLNYKKYLYIGIIFIILVSITQLSLPYLFGNLIDCATEKTNKGLFTDLSLVAVLIFICFLLNSIFKLLKSYYFFLFSEKSIIDITNSIFSNLIRKPLSFFDTNQTGDLISRINIDVAAIRNILSEQIVSVIYQPFIIIACICILFTLNIKLTLLLIITFPIAILFSLKLATRIRRLSKETLECYSEANIILEESIQLIRTIKAFSNEHLVEDKYMGKLREIFNKSRSTAIAKIAIEGVASFVVLLGVALIVLYATYLVSNNSITVGELVQFIICTVFIGNSFSSISTSYGIIQKTASAIERVKKLVNDESEYLVHKQKDQSIYFKKNISFMNITFCYPSRKESIILNNVNLEIKQGQKIGIIGESGSGKSTLIHLLLKFYSPTKGQIIIDGIDIENMSLSVYRRLFAIVSQEIKLFSGTIRDNIKYGNQNATDDEVLDACMIANCYEFIQQMPSKFNSIIGENGITLSGGQRQRIAIARAVLANPQILILDEATSALDWETESNINLELLKFMKNKTTLILSHKMDLIMKMDRVLKVESGNLVEISKENISITSDINY